MSIKKEKRIALFGGSFDPVHTDHLNIAIACHEQLGFDEVWMIPTFISPFKTKTNSSRFDRLAMLNLATKDYDWIHINEYEISLERPSYTYQTVSHFLNDPEYQSYEFDFIMGSDQLDSFENWDHFSDLIQAIDFKVFKRSDDYNQAIVDQYHLEVFDFNRIGLSSTMIRNLEGLKEQLKPVNDYINNNLLYLDERLGQQMDEQRYQHSINVGLMAVELAKQHGINEQQALVAGTLHDVAKRWDKEKSAEYLKMYAPDLINEPLPVWHSFVGAMHLKYDWLIDDEEIIEAVFNHTVGKPKMSPLDKIIFCADKISQERDYPEVEQLRISCFKDLDVGFKQTLNQAVKFAQENHHLNTLGPMMNQTCQYYLVEDND